MSNIKQIETTGTADGTVSLATFPYNPLACQIQVMRYYDPQGNDITDSLPSGSVLYEFRAAADPDDAEWRPFDIAKRNVLTDGTNAIPKVTSSLVREIRATFSNFPAGTTFKSVATCQYDAMPELDARIVGGTQAVNVQPFTEANSKNGTQYEAAFYIPSLPIFNPDNPDASSAFVAIQIGILPVALKDIQVGFKSLLFSVDTWRNPIFTGGAEIPVFNMNDELAVPDDVTLLANPTVTNKGTQVSPTVYTLGTQNAGNRINGTISNTAGVERILWRNSTYLLRVTNRDTVNTTPVTAVATWYQGGLSIEL